MRKVTGWNESKKKKVLPNQAVRACGSDLTFHATSVFSSSSSSSSSPSSTQSQFHNPTMKKTFTQTNLISLLIFLSFSTTPIFSHLFSPLDNYLINTGSTSPTTFNNRLFTAEHSSFSTSHPLFINNQNPLPNLPSIYHTARVFTKSTKYSFPVKIKGTHLVRFHFHAFNSSNLDLGHAKFQILVNGYVVLSNFTRFVSDSETNPRVVEYLIWVDYEKVEIVFVPSKDSNFAFVNAIEVISAPKDLVPETAQFLSEEGLKSFDDLNKQAFEVVYRVTVGGPKVTPFNDSLWRTWVPDDEFLKSSVGSEKFYFGGRINYRVGGASREVGPDNVYNTARLIKSRNDSVPNVNMTWVFPVVGGYKYLVRLHFCDIASISMRLLYFNVYVNGYLAFEDLDLSLVTNALASPFYADFVVDGDSSVGALSVSIGPSKSSIPHVVDGMLNAVEVMKLNNTHRSLDGDVCADFVLKSHRSSGNTGILLTLAAAACIVLSLSIVIRRRIIESRESVSWSRLPVNLSQDNVKG